MGHGFRHLEKKQLQRQGLRQKFGQVAAPLKQDLFLLADKGMLEEAAAHRAKLIAEGRLKKAPLRIRKKK